MSDTLWHLCLAAVALLLAFAFLHPAPATVSAEAADNIRLQESGHFSGSGYHEISARGPLCYITILPANESILTANNGTVWKVLSNGTLREVA